VDGLDYTAAEISTLEKLNKSGTPIIAIGGTDVSATAQKFFGVTVSDTSVKAASGAIPVTADGATVAYIFERPGRGPIICCPAQPANLDGPASQALAAAILKTCGEPVQVSTGTAVTTFVNHDRLFVSLGDQGDVTRSISVSLSPSRLNPELTAKSWKVIDIDRSTEIPSTTEDGRVEFSLPTVGSDGHMIMLLPGVSSAKGAVN